MVDQAMSYFLWCVGTVLDWLHMPGIVIVIMYGQLWMSQKTHAIVLCVIGVLQIAVLGCPLMPVILALKRPYEPTYDYGGSITYWLYHRYGPVVAIPIVLGSFVLAALFAKWFATLSESSNG